MFSFSPGKYPFFNLTSSKRSIKPSWNLPSKGFDSVWLLSRSVALDSSRLSILKAILYIV